MNRQKGLGDERAAGHCTGHGDELPDTVLLSQRLQRERVVTAGGSDEKGSDATALLSPMLILPSSSSSSSSPMKLAQMIFPRNTTSSPVGRHDERCYCHCPLLEEQPSRLVRLHDELQDNQTGRLCLYFDMIVAATKSPPRPTRATATTTMQTTHTIEKQRQVFLSLSGQWLFSITIVEYMHWSLSLSDGSCSYTCVCV